MFSEEETYVHVCLKTTYTRAQITHTHAHRGEGRGRGEGEGVRAGESAVCPRQCASLRKDVVLSFPCRANGRTVRAVLPACLEEPSQKS